MHFRTVGISLQRLSQQGHCLFGSTSVCKEVGKVDSGIDEGWLQRKGFFKGGLRFAIVLTTAEFTRGAGVVGSAQIGPC